MTKGEAEKGRGRGRHGEELAQCVSCQPVCAYVCVFLFACMRVPCVRVPSALFVCRPAAHTKAQRGNTQMGKQSHCLLFCFLLCWERLVVIDFFFFSQSGPRRVEASGKRSHQWPYLSSHTHMLRNTLTQSLNPPQYPTTIESVTPLSVPITVCLPEVCR